MKILCTGGAGYVGSACLRWLLAQGHDAVAFDDLSTGNRGAVPQDRLLEGDIGERSALTRALEAHGSDAVMHFAAVASVPESVRDPEVYWRTNVIGTKNVLDAMVECGVRRIVFSSTAATYAFDNEMPLAEGASLIPQTPYGTSKLACERMISDYAHAYDLGYAILRYFNASGADPDGQHGEDRSEESHLIPLIFSVALGIREKLMIYGSDWDTRDGTCVRDYVHTEDLARAHELSVAALEPGIGLTFNLGSSTGSTVLEVLKACERVAGSPIPHECADPRPGDPPVLIANADRIRHELGWKPQYADIGLIVETAWRWHQSHPQGYGGAESTSNTSGAEDRSADGHQLGVCAGTRNR